METILQYAQGLVYTLVHLMPSHYQQDSLKALFGLFLEAQGHALPQHSEVKSPSSLSRFFNHYQWSTRSVLRSARQTVLEQLRKHPPRRNSPLKVIVDLTTLEKTGKFKHLSNQTSDPNVLNYWVLMLNGKRGLHLVVLYLEVGQWRVPWSFRVWRGKGYDTPVRLACKLLASVPASLIQTAPVIVLADTEFGAQEFLDAVRKRSWRPVVGMRGNRKLADGRSLRDLYRNGSRGQQVYLSGLSYPLTVSWFWLKRAQEKRELRFVVSTYPYSGAYLVQLGRKRWAIESFFKTAKHRFGLHCFGQDTKLGVYRWLLLALIAYTLAHWIDRWCLPPQLDWRAAGEKALSILFPLVVWLKLLHQIRIHQDVAHRFGFEINLKSLSTANCECCKI